MDKCYNKDKNERNMIKIELKNTEDNKKNVNQ